VGLALLPAVLLATLLFLRSPTTNCVYDEQEALLGNPYVNAQGIPFWRVLHRDFWGLPPTASIGSYRPLPNLLWRPLWHLAESPWLLSWLNVLAHALNAALLASYTAAVTKDRKLGWIAGFALLGMGVLTEAVSGVVGLADVLAATGLLLALQATRRSLWVMPFGVAAGTLLGVLGKETALVGLGLLPLLVWLTAPSLHGERPRRWLRALVALVALALVTVLYVEVRRRVFPAPLPASLAAPLPATASPPQRMAHALARWFHQPQLPTNELNNPLSIVPASRRVAAALSIYARGLGQVLFPWTLSGDYSYPQELAPRSLLAPWVLVGALLMAGPLLLALLLATWRLGRDTSSSQGALGERALLVAGLAWIPLAYFPVSNLLIVLPTVRAERLWYVPALGAAWLIALGTQGLLRRARSPRGALAARVVVLAFFAFQLVAARRHACDYADDLAFWGATRRASPLSAKAHLNYSIMLGARGRLAERVVVGQRAVQLAPEWPMAHVYQGDALCRDGKPEQALPFYEAGFELSPDNKSLIALGLQCLWETKHLMDYEGRLRAVAERHPGSWLAYLIDDLFLHGGQYGGVRPEYRPRSYNAKRPSGE